MTAGEYAMVVSSSLRKQQQQQQAKRLTAVPSAGQRQPLIVSEKSLIKSILL